MNSTYTTAQNIDEVARLIELNRATLQAIGHANRFPQGELGVETDTNKMKIGDGSTAWSSLCYLIDTGGYVIIQCDC